MLNFLIIHECNAFQFIVQVNKRARAVMHCRVDWSLIVTDLYKCMLVFELLVRGGLIGGLHCTVDTPDFMQTYGTPRLPYI